MSGQLAIRFSVSSARIWLGSSKFRFDIKSHVFKREYYLVCVESNRYRCPLKVLSGDAFLASVNLYVPPVVSWLFALQVLLCTTSCCILSNWSFFASWNMSRTLGLCHILQHCPMSQIHLAWILVIHLPCCDPYFVCVPGGSRYHSERGSSSTW